MNKKSYCICAPHYDRRSSGIKALYVLCHKLNNLGYDAYITGSPRDSGYNCKDVFSLSPDQLKDLQLNGVVVYPDYIINGNPLKFTHVVRWFLGITQETLEHELVFSMSPSHNFQVQAKHNLMMLDVEPYFKLPEIENRTKKCFRVGKGSAIPRLPITDGCIEITADYPSNRVELAKLLQESEVLYTYDNFTFLITEAILCGCPVVILGNPITEKENLKDNVLFKYGAGFYDDPDLDIQKLKEEIPLQIELWNQLMETSKQELLTFIELTQNMNNEYVEDSRYIHPHPWIALGFWNDFFSLFKEG